MAFAYTVSDSRIDGKNKQMAFGTYTNTGGSTGGDIVTALSVVEYFQLQPKGSSVIATQSVVNETLPLSNSTGAVTVVTSADEVGYWFAFGL